MRLKCMKLSGFKSFVDPTTVSFPSNLCGVVGPNGCGKSNIIDAVRWVMGESSAKQLRGESITDVIFNGSNGRKPVGQASIELIFDNSDGRIGGEYAAFSEIAVRRRVNREGNSDYFINGTRCRRRDLVDIFLGTGLGPRSYAIIEQGMISSMVTARPDELRIYIEEAAGISKYKERRRDTENRMRHTRENLDRLTDIRDELERVLQRLKRQASAAERFRELKTDERRIQLELHALRWQELNRSLQQQQTRVRESELELEKKNTELAVAQSGIERARADIQELNRVFADVQGRYYAQGAEVARVEQQIQSVRSASKRRAEELDRTRQQRQHIAETLEFDRNKLVGLDAELGEILDHRKSADLEAQTAGQALQLLERQGAEQQAEWENLTREIADQQRQADVLKNQLQHAETSLKQSMEHKARLTAVIQDDASLKQMREAIESRAADLATLDTQHKAITEQEVQAQQQLKDKKDVEANLRDRLAQVRGQLGADEARRQSLVELYDAAMALDPGSGTEWVKAQGLGDAPRLASSIKVEAGWEYAVELALGSHLTDLLCDDLTAYTGAISAFQGGSLGLLQRSSDIPQLAETSLGHKVDQTAAKALLARIKTADSLEQALSMRASLKQDESVITAEGVWLGRGWVRIRAAAGAMSGVLQKRSEIDRLINLIEQAQATEGQLQTDHAAAVAEVQKGEQLLVNLRASLASTARNLGDVRSEWAAQKSRFEQILDARTAQIAELSAREAAIQQALTDSADVRQRLAGILDSMEALNQRREQMQTARKKFQDDFALARQARQVCETQSQQLALREQRISTQKAAVQEAMARLQRQATQLEVQEAELKPEAEGADTTLPTLEEALAGHLAQRLEGEKQLTRARADLQNRESELQALEKARQQLANDADAFKDKLQELRLLAQDLTTRCATILEQMEDTEPGTLLSRLDESASVAGWDEQIAALALKIERLGPINLAAIDEYREESERKTYLDAQSAELEQALATLENAIRKIDRETRTRFKETFDQINSGFKTLFPQLFGGGHAYLELTSEDLLETGIGIMARPPGKRNATVQLLSGGEKALTAIALVFAIFQLNPAPFCMLDEVDAPLDDANVARFADLVRKMSSQVQFIFITHNKITMEMADHLMGVTMYEPGVSRLVSVDVNKAVELAEA